MVDLVPQLGVSKPKLCLGQGINKSALLLNGIYDFFAEHLSLLKYVKESKNTITKRWLG